MLGRDEEMQPRFVDFQNFVQDFGFASREAIQETHQVGFLHDCDTGVDFIKKWYSCLDEVCIARLQKKLSMQLIKTKISK